MSFHVKTVVFYTLKKENLFFFFSLLPFWSKWQQSISESEFAGQNLSCSPAQLSGINPARELCGSSFSIQECYKHEGSFQLDHYFRLTAAAPEFQTQQDLGEEIFRSWTSTTRFGWGDVQSFLTGALWSKLRLWCRKEPINVATDQFQPELQKQGCSERFPFGLPGH